MVRNRDPFSTALDDLRGRLTSGAYSGGASIVILDEAKRLKLSTTPVREALAWLSGAGLVEHVSTGGYRASRIEPAIVRDAYSFRLDCLLLSLRDFVGPSRPTLMLAAPEDLFDWIIGRAGNSVLASAFHRVSFFLRRLQDAEGRIFADGDAVLDVMVRSLIDERLDLLVDLIEAYHRDRISACAVLAFEADHAPPNPS